MDSWGERLRAATQAGTQLDITAGGSTDPARAQTWDPGRTLPADQLREALLDPTLHADPRGLCLIGARITGTLDLQGASLPYPLTLQRCSFTHQPNLAQATLPHLDLTGSHLPGLAAHQLRITHGDLDLTALVATGQVSAPAATIDGQLVVIGAYLTQSGERALFLDGVHVTGDIVVNGGFTATGEVSAAGATIDGQLRMTGAHLTNQDGFALRLDGTHVTDVFLNDGFTATGEVRAVGATINGVLQMSSAHLTNEDGCALGLDKAHIAGGMFLNDGFTATGQVRASGATINGTLNMSGALLTNEDGCALRLDKAHITGGVFLNDGFTATGQVRARGATINGTLEMSGAHLTNQDGCALGLDKAHITGDVFLNDGFTATGEVCAVGVTIDGTLAMTGTGTSISFEQAALASLYLGPGYAGPISLGYATIGVLTIDPELQPQPGWWVGIQLRSVHGALTTTSGATAWLDKDLSNPADGFNPHPWHQIGDIHARAGRTESATHLRVEAARRTTKAAAWWRKPLRWASFVFTGYGYYPLLAAVWLVGAALAAALLAFFNPWAFATTDVATQTAGLNPWLYGIGTVIPAGFTDQWIINSWWVAASILALRVFGWIQTALLLAGLAGLLRKN